MLAISISAAYLPLRAFVAAAMIDRASASDSPVPFFMSNPKVEECEAQDTPYEIATVFSPPTLRSEPDYDRLDKPRRPIRISNSPRLGRPAAETESIS